MYDNKITISTDGKEVSVEFNPPLVTTEEEYNKLGEEDKIIQSFFINIATAIQEATGETK